MRAHRVVLTFAALLGLAGASAAATIKVVDFETTNAPPPYAWVGRALEVMWIAGGVGASATVKVELLKAGAPPRLLAAAVPVGRTDEANAQGERSNYYVWTPGPAPADVGCGYAFRVTLNGLGASASTKSFNIYDALQFKDSHGNVASVRLDAPNGGVLIAGRTATITWSSIGGPSYNPAGTVRLELFFQGAKVGDIAEVPVNRRACTVRGQYPWVVGRVASAANPALVPDGKNAAPGNFYEVRVSTGGVGYLGGTFVIALTSGRPSPGGTAVPKVTPGAGTIKD